LLVYNIQKFKLYWFCYIHRWFDFLHKLHRIWQTVVIISWQVSLPWNATITVITCNSAHCLILRTTMNNIDMQASTLTEWWGWGEQTGGAPNRETHIFFIQENKHVLSWSFSLLSSNLCQIWSIYFRVCLVNLYTVLFNYLIATDTTFTFHVKWIMLSCQNHVVNILSSKAWTSIWQVAEWRWRGVEWWGWGEQTGGAPNRETSEYLNVLLIKVTAII
jgi:hypothetical protein